MIESHWIIFMTMIMMKLVATELDIDHLSHEVILTIIT